MTGQRLGRYEVTARLGAGGIWSVPANGGRPRPIAALGGRRGRLEHVVVRGDDAYFAWREDIADIWVMDVVRREDR